MIRAQAIDNGYYALTAAHAKTLSIDGRLPRLGYEKKADPEKLHLLILVQRQPPIEGETAPPRFQTLKIDARRAHSAWISETPFKGKMTWSIRLTF